MLQGFVGIWASFLALSPVIAASIVDEYLKNSDIQEGKRLSSKMYERCLEMDAEACVGYKLLNSAVNYFHEATENQSAQTGGQETEEQVDGILLQKFLELLTPSSIWTTSRTADGARRTLRLKKKMLFPLLLGVVLKFVSVIPVVLGKLAFAGTMALMASKLSLLLVSVMGLKKLFTGSDGGLSQQGHHYDDGQYSYYGGGGQYAHKRVTYHVRGRGLADQEDWTPSSGVQSRRFVTGHTEGRSGNLKTAKGVESQGYLLHSIGSENRVNVSETSKDRTQNEDKEYESSRLRQPKSSKSRHQQPDINVQSSRRNRNYEEHKTANLTKETRPHMGNESYESNLVHHTLNPNSRSYGDSVTATPHGAHHTRGSAQTRVMSRAIDTRYDQQFEKDAERGHKEPENTQNKATRLVKRHYRGDMEGQNHDRPYSAGRRRLDEVEGERVDAWARHRQMSGE